MSSNSLIIVVDIILKSTVEFQMDWVWNEKTITTHFSWVCSLFRNHPDIVIHQLLVIQITILIFSYLTYIFLPTFHFQKHSCKSFPTPDHPSVHQAGSTRPTRPNTLNWNWNISVQSLPQQTIPYLLKLYHNYQTQLHNTALISQASQPNGFSQGTWV